MQVNIISSEILCFYVLILLMNAAVLLQNIVGS